MRVGLCGFALFAIIANSVFSEDTPKSVRIGSGVLRMNAIAAPTPEYPQEFFRAGREGTVIATIRVETDGAVSTADVLEATDDLMGTSVVRALKQRRFKPFKTDANEAIRVTSRLVFHFAIRNGQPMVVEGTGAPHA